MLYSPGNSSLTNPNVSLASFIIGLSEQELTETRTYSKLIAVIGDVGGFMEVIFTLLSIISSLSVNILYEITLVNHIFDYNIKKQIIILKGKKNQKGDIILNNEIPRISNTKNLERNLSSQNSIIGKKEKNENNNKNNEEDSNKKRAKLYSTNENLLYINMEKEKSKIKGDSNCALNFNNNDNNFKILSLSKRNTNRISEQVELNIIKSNTNIKDENNQSKENIISKIKIRRASIYFGFLFIRKRKTIENILLDEGMSVIKEKLDIFNIFDKIYRSEKIHEKLVKEEVYSKCLMSVKKSCYL